MALAGHRTHLHRGCAGVAGERVARGRRLVEACARGGGGPPGPRLARRVRVWRRHRRRSGGPWHRLALAVRHAFECARLGPDWQRRGRAVGAALVSGRGRKWVVTFGSGSASFGLDLGFGERNGGRKSPRDSACGHPSAGFKRASCAGRAGNSAAHADVRIGCGAGNEDAGDGGQSRRDTGRAIFGGFRWPVGGLADARGVFAGGGCGSFVDWYAVFIVGTIAFGCALALFSELALVNTLVLFSALILIAKFALIGTIAFGRALILSGACLFLRT